MSRAGDELRQAAGTAYGWGRAAVGAIDGALIDQLGHLPGPLASVGQQVRDVLRALARLPLPTDEVQALVEQLHAQRQSIQAMEAQLSALDHQLRLLEQSLHPLEVWVGQVQDLRESLVRERVNA